MTTRAAKKATPKKHWSDVLAKHDACSEAVAWAKKQPSAKVAWTKCTRADWMLWIVGRLTTTLDDRKAIVLVACACARTALKYVPEGETRPLVAIETTERWCRGEATIEEVRRARSDVWSANAAYAAYAAANAAYAAYAAANAAANAAYAAAYAAYAAANAAAYAANAANAVAARSRALKKMATIVREHMSMPQLAKRVTHAAA